MYPWLPPPARPSKHSLSALVPYRNNATHLYEPKFFFFHKQRDLFRNMKIDNGNKIILSVIYASKRRKDYQCLTLVGTELHPTETRQSIRASGHKSCASLMAKIVGLFARMAPSCHRFTSERKANITQIPLSAAECREKTLGKITEITIWEVIKIIRGSRRRPYRFPYSVLAASHEGATATTVLAEGTRSHTIGGSTFTQPQLWGAYRILRNENKIYYYYW